MDNFRKAFVLMILTVFACQSFVLHLNNALAASGTIVINEVAWAGTADESNDEFMELFNNSRSAVDLSGWKIEDDNGSSIYTIDSGSISANGFFVIADSEVALSGVTIDKAIGLSLANSGDSLVLKNAVGTVVDSVNVSGQAWYAGNSTGKASMERIDPGISQDAAGNWGTCASGNGAKGRTGLAVLGTPGSVNSVFGGAGTKVVLEVSGDSFFAGDTALASVKISEAEDFFAYGFKINYDPTVVEFVSATEGSFLAGDDETSFNYALENNAEGNLVVAGTRFGNPPTGVSGNGELFSLNFNVIGSPGESTEIDFVSGESFVSDVLGDVSAGFIGGEISVGAAVTVGTVLSPKAEAGDERYSLELSWIAPADGADKYVIKRKDFGENFISIGETTSLSFIDKDGINGAGKLIPAKDYEYQIFAVKSGISGTAVSVVGKENRGIKGDMSRDDKVNGRDLEKLARSFGLGADEEKFDALCDTNYDGVVDGSDLIDIGANFGRTFSL